MIQFFHLLDLQAKQANFGALKALVCFLLFRSDFLSHMDISKSSPPRTARGPRWRRSLTRWWRSRPWKLLPPCLQATQVLAVWGVRGSIDVRICFLLLLLLFVVCYAACLRFQPWWFHMCGWIGWIMTFYVMLSSGLPFHRHFRQKVVRCFFCIPNHPKTYWTQVFDIHFAMVNYGQQVSNRQWRGVVDWNVVLTGSTSDCCIVIRRWTVILHWTKWVSSSTPTAVLPWNLFIRASMIFWYILYLHILQVFFSFKILLMKDSIYIFSNYSGQPHNQLSPNFGTWGSGKISWNFGEV